MFAALILLFLGLSDIALVMSVAWSHPHFWTFFWLYMGLQCVHLMARSAIKDGL